ncbi:YkgJ family cysteine cluster protein [Saccharicrinis sp. FJH2]|uniref:YkgJ family cysteine cluster protein n=1 Tax=unclassified Saccharicrinis TaxID=2646859 RepID=UPI0035D3F151
MKCRENCGACCIAPSISSPIPGMPNGKKAGEQCIHLTNDFRCGIFTSPERPKVCAGFMAEELVCGHSREEALTILSELEASCRQS